MQKESKEDTDLPSDETARLFVMISNGLNKSWEAYKEDHFSDMCRELAATKSDLDSLIRIGKLKLKELENELIA